MWQTYKSKIRISIVEVQTSLTKKQLNPIIIAGLENKSIPAMKSNETNKCFIFKFYVIMKKKNEILYLIEMCYQMETTNDWGGLYVLQYKNEYQPLLLKYWFKDHDDLYNSIKIEKQYKTKQQLILNKLNNNRD